MNKNQPEAATIYSSLLHIFKALCNEKVMFVLLVTGLSLTVGLSFLVYTFSIPGYSTMTGRTIFLTVLLSAWLAGISISGLLLMDQACGRTPPRLLGKAVFDGISALFSILGVVLIGIALMAVFYLFLVLLLLLCKLPTIGSVLYAVLLPVLKILGGTLLFGLIAGLSMVGPAIWYGATAREALQRLRQIVANHAVELLANLFLLTLFIILAGFILICIVLIGNFLIRAPSVFFLDSSLSDTLSDTLNISALASGYLRGEGATEPFTAFFRSMSEYKLAAIFGSITGLVLVSAALTAMALMGANLIYLQITKNLLLAGERASAQDAELHENEDKITVQTYPKGPTTGNPYPKGPTTDNRGNYTPSAPLVPSPTKTSLTCPACKVQALPGDRYCGICGSPIQG